MTSSERYRDRRRAMVKAESAEKKYRLAWFTDSMEIVGWFERRPLNYRFGLLRRESESPPVYTPVVSIPVPKSLAEGYGSLKRKVVGRD